MSEFLDMILDGEGLVSRDLFLVQLYLETDKIDLPFKVDYASVRGYSSWLLEDRHTRRGYALLEYLSESGLSSSGGDSDTAAPSERWSLSIPDLARLRASLESLYLSVLSADLEDLAGYFTSSIYGERVIAEYRLSCAY
jgi:hypothetical protein